LSAMLSYYHEPVTFITTQGVVSRSSHADVIPILTQFFERLKVTAATRSEWADAHVKRLSDVLAIASIIVVRYNAEGHEVERVGWTYLLHRTGGRWKIAVLAAHPANNILRL